MSTINRVGQLQNFSNCPATQFNDCTSCICSYPLLEKISTNWKEILMDASTIVCTTCLALSFFTGATFYSAAFFIASIASAIGSFYMRQIALMTDLETTAKNLRGENNRLHTINDQLVQNNTAYRENNQTLTQTNQRLDNQVTQLSLHNTQLRESAERIRSEMLVFQQENIHLHTNVKGFDNSLRVLDQQIGNSKSLCEQIANHLQNQQQGLGQQLETLSQYLHELRSENSVSQRIQSLAVLQDQARQENERLHDIRLQFVQERANFQAIREALVKVKTEFEQVVRNASSSMQSNNQQFQNNNQALSQQTRRIQDILTRHFGSEVQV